MRALDVWNVIFILNLQVVANLQRAEKAEAEKMVARRELAQCKQNFTKVQEVFWMQFALKSMDVLLSKPTNNVCSCYNSDKRICHRMLDWSSFEYLPRVTATFRNMLLVYS